MPVYFRMFRDDHWGRTVWTETGPVIYMSATLGPIAHRCTLSHEIQHLELGAPDIPECPANEAEVVRRTARWLLPDLTTLGRLLVGHGVVEAAKQMQVTRRVLTDRMQNLTESETARLSVILEKAGVAA